MPGDVRVVFQHRLNGVPAAKGPEDRGNQNTGSANHGLAVADGRIDLEAGIHESNLGSGRSSGKPARSRAQAVRSLRFFDAAVLIRREDDLEAVLHRERAEALDELAELLDGPTGEGLRPGIAWAGGGDAAPAYKRTTRIQRPGRSG